MRALRFTVPLILAFALVGCGSEQVVTMPEVTSKKLDVALEKIKDAGFDDDVEVKGGGLFGVVDEGNWTVCEQSPAKGKAIAAEPKLTVERSCDKRKKKPKPTATPSAKPTPALTSAAPTTPAATTPPASKLPKILTVKNSPEFAAILKLGDNCSDQIGSFAKKHAGQKIRFDGSIGAMAAHGDAKTRFDMLVGPGDDGVNTAVGPNFQFADKNAFDMNLSGQNIPDHLSVDQKYTFTAQVESFSSDNCLFQLDPIETKTR